MNTYLPLIGRIGLSLVFLLQGIMKAVEFEQSWQKLDLKGIPMAPMVMILAIGIELIGGIAVLVGFNVKTLAFIVAVYLVPTTFLFHPFWADLENFSDFLKNLAIMGGLLTLSYHGAGPYSIDAKKLW